MKQDLVIVPIVVPLRHKGIDSRRKTCCIVDKGFSAIHANNIHSHGHPCYFEFLKRHYHEAEYKKHYDVARNLQPT